MIQGYLSNLDLSLREWDILVFLHRHRALLASAEEISRLVGYAADRVAEALDTLESLKLIRRSKAGQLQLTEVTLAPGSYFEQLISLGQDRTGRLSLAKNLRGVRNA